MAYYSQKKGEDNWFKESAIARLSHNEQSISMNGTHTGSGCGACSTATFPLYKFTTFQLGAVTAGLGPTMFDSLALLPAEFTSSKIPHG